MDQVCFEDDLKEFRKLTYGLLVISFVVIAALVTNICTREIQENYIKSIILTSIIALFLVCISVYFALYVAKYKVQVINNRIIVKSLFGNKTVELTNQIIFSRKKYNSKYEIFFITVGNKKITVRTKKSDELIKILQYFTSAS